MNTQTLVLHAQLALETTRTQTVGYVRAQHAQPHLLLTDLKVEPLFRQQGIGRNLVRSVLQALERSELESAYVYTDKLRFFGRLGFKPVRASMVPQTIVPLTSRRGHAQWLVVRRCAHPCDWQGVTLKLQADPESPTP